MRAFYLDDDPFWLVTCPSYQSIWWLYWWSYFILYRLDIVYIVVKATSLIRLYSHVGHKCSFWLGSYEGHCHLEWLNPSPLLPCTNSLSIQPTFFFLVKIFTMATNIYIYLIQRVPKIFLKKCAKIITFWKKKKKKKGVVKLPYLGFRVLEVVKTWQDSKKLPLTYIAIFGSFFLWMITSPPTSPKKNSLK
jgi:hypothetical protein